MGLLWHKEVEEGIPRWQMISLSNPELQERLEVRGCFSNTLAPSFMCSWTQKSLKSDLFQPRYAFLPQRWPKLSTAPVFQFSARIFRTKNFDANFLDFAKNHVTRFGLSHNIDDYMRLSRSNRKIIGTRGTLVDHSWLRSTPLRSVSLRHLWSTNVPLVPIIFRFSFLHLI